MLTSVLALPLLFLSASAFKLTANTPDGVYMVFQDELGNEVHKEWSEDYLVKDVPAGITVINATSPEGPIMARGPWRDNIWCGCGFTMDHGNCDAAVEELKKSMGVSGAYVTVPSWFSKKNNVVAFVCNYKSDQNYFYINSQYFHDSLATVTDSCGWYVAGSEGYQARTDIASIGYMQFKEGVDFCANALGSPNHNC
jgi:hypothetical protein